MPPVNDDFANATVITGTSGSVTGSNVGATWEAGEPVQQAGSGTNTVWWSWTAPASGDFAFTLDGSSFDTVLEVYTGSALGALALVDYNDDGDTGLTSDLTISAVAGTTYRLRVHGYDNTEAGSISLAWDVAPPAPPSISSFSPHAGEVGDTVTILGSGFTGATSVVICGAVASFVVDSDTQVTATVPTGAAGTGTVTVVTPSGSDSLGPFTPRYPGRWITPDPFWHEFDPTLAQTTHSHGTGADDATALSDCWLDHGTETTTSGQPVTVGTRNNGDHTFDAWQGHLAGPAPDNPIGVLGWTEVPPPLPPDAVDYEWEGGIGATGTVIDWHVKAVLDSITGSQTDRGFVFEWEIVLDWQGPGDIQTMYAEATGGSPDTSGQLGPPDQLVVPGTISAGYTVTWQPDISYWYPNGFHNIAFSIYPERMRDYPTVQPVGELVATWSIHDLWRVQLPRFRWLYDRPLTASRLRQFPRDDALGGAPRQGRRNSSKSVQSSQRQGHRNTYR